MATAMPCPWWAPRARMRRTRRSSVPWRRASRGGWSVLVDTLLEYSDLLVERQPERAEAFRGCDRPIIYRPSTDLSLGFTDLPRHYGRRPSLVTPVGRGALREAVARGELNGGGRGVTFSDSVHA